MTPRLEMRGLSKRFGDVEAVSKLSLALAPGEFVSLLGPSGCGKSTTLAMVAGFEPPTAGAVVVDGKDMTGTPPGRRRIGLVFQDYAVFSRLSVRDNLLFGLEAQRLPRSERKRRIEAMAEKLELGSLMRRRGASLNMSEMQRVAIARALVTEPSLLLLDEPMSNLDASLRAALRGELKLIQKQLDQTVLYVTHDQIEAMSMSDRIAVMRAGRIEQIGTPEDIYHRPATGFVAGFIGDPPINLVACTVKRSGTKAAVASPLHKGVELESADMPDGEHALGVRPHDVKVSRRPRSDHLQASVRFVENLGAENILHLEFGSSLLAAVTPPGFAAAGEDVWIKAEPRQLHFIRRDDDRVVRAKGA